MPQLLLVEVVPEQRTLVCPAVEYRIVETGHEDDGPLQSRVATFCAIVNALSTDMVAVLFWEIQYDAARAAESATSWSLRDWS